MKSLYNLIVIFILTFGFNGFGQWEERHTAPDHIIEHLSFVNDNVGYAFMHELFGFNVALKKTSDDGNTWTEINLPVLGPQFLDMHFYADGKGVAVFRDFSDTITPTQIYQTLNDGATWEDVSPDSTVIGIGHAQGQFIDGNIGFLAVGQTLYTTIDGGTSWNSFPLSSYIVSMEFIDANHGTIGLFDGTFSYLGSVYSTDNGGASWNGFDLTEIQSVIGEVMQISTDIAYAAPVKWGSGMHHKFFKTIDNGNTWDTIFIPDYHNSSHFADIDFRNELDGVISIRSADTTFIYHTLNGGNDWIFNDSTTVINNSFELELTPNTGYLAGAPGVFLKYGTTNSIQNFQSNPLKIYPNPVQKGQNIKWNLTGEFDISINDLSGKVVYQQSLLTQNTLQIPNLPEGTYIIQFRNDANIKVGKLVIN